MTRKHHTAGIIALLAISGLAAAAGAQVTPDREDQTDSSLHTEHQSAGGPWELRRASSLMGADLENATGETVATLEDIIFERGTGRWTHAVIKSGSVLGVGGKTVAVPVSRLTGTGEHDKLMLDMSEAEIDQAAEFKAEEWANLDHTSWMEQFGQWDDDDDMQGDRYRENVDWSGAPETVTGTIREIDRSGGEDGDQTVVTVETADGETHKVVVGPSWYVAGQDVVLYRGDTVSLEACPCPDGSDADFVATRVTQEGKSMDLRDQQGSPAWEGAHGQSATRPRLGLASDLVGAEVLMPTEENSGEIEDAVVDLQRHRIVMVELDPNENFLGIGDELKCVPWPLITVADQDTVRLDTDKDTLVSCEMLPEDITTITSREQLDQFYRPFGLDVEREGRHTAGAQDWREGGAAGADQTVEALALGENIEISGRITSVSERRVEGFDEPVMVATVTTDGGGSEQVVLAPASHCEANPLGLREGDEVTIEAKRADVNGQMITAACTIESDDQEITLWRDGRPVWS